jgi:PAS domain S-box-containing protein
MNLSKTKLIESVFPGTGEMAALMRAFDWSTTPLGPVEEWPQALRICAQIVLRSGYPMSICWGPQHVMLYNDAYRPPMGAKHPWALGRSCHDVFPETWGFMGPLHERILTQGQETSFLTNQLVSLNRNNYLEECYFAFSYGPIPDDYGHVGGVLGTGLETTERVLEDRRRQVLRDLASRTVGARNEEEVWRVSAETLGEHRLSIPFAFLYEYRPAEHQAYLAGTSVETDETLHPAVIDCHSGNLWQLDPALTRDGIVVELGDRASGLSVPNWPDRPKEACVVPIRLGEHSEALGFLVAGIHPGRAFDDAYRQFVLRINEQITIGLTSARAYAHEHQRADALAELDRAKTAFFSNVSHEFRTPLTLMLGPLEEMLREPDERASPEHHEQLATVHRNALRLVKLVNTLLDFSRIEAGRVQASYQPTDLASFTSEIASAFDSAMQNAGLRFSVECQLIAEPVYVDRDMWEKIVLNLLSNAYKFTFEGEIALTLKLVDGAVELKIRDTGVGIPEEQRDRVFERFHRIEGTQARTYEGTGIGLALVQELVKLHGGRVRVESLVGAGSTFTVTIPCGKQHLPAGRIQAAPSLASTKIRAEAYVEEAEQWSGDQSGAVTDAATVATSPLLTSSPEPETGAKRELIIVADDNADMRQYLRRLLHERYQIYAVADGREALDATRRVRPALVVADVMMPQLDGFGLLRAIREDPALAGTPVMLLSARAGEESRVEGLQAGADDYLIKPFTARELLARVETHVKMANLRRETAEREEQLRSEAELEREKLRASEERLAETSRLYRELQRAEAELQLQVGLLQHLPVSAWTLKPDGTPDFVNRVWLEFSGQTLDFVRSHPEAWMTAIHPEDRETAGRAFWEGVRSGKGFAIETRSRCAKDGTYRWHLQQAEVLRDAEGKVLKFVGTTTDIDDQKRLQEELRAKELDARSLLDNMPGFLARISADGTPEIFNRPFLEYLGTTLEELKKWRTSDFVHPDDLAHTIEVFGNGISGGQPFDFQYRLRRFDGVYRWFQVRIVPVRNVEGRILHWNALVTDIEERKRAEEALRASEASLAQAQYLSRTGSFSWKVANDEIVWSEQLYRIFDFEPGTPVTIERINSRVHPDDLAAMIERVARARISGGPFEYEHRLAMPDGSVKYLMAMAQGSLNAEGKLEYMGAVQDITTRRLSEEALAKARTELARVASITSLGVLTASMAHEVNQPLSGIITNASTCLRMLDANPPNVEGARETARRTIRDGHRASDVITRLRTLYSRKEPALESMDLNEAAREVTALSSTEIQRNGVTLRQEYADDLPPALGDRIQLQQVILNLVRNAADAMSTIDDRPKELLVRTERGEGNQVRLSVKDSGVGFASQAADKIFEPFYTTKTDGMGIGLSISRSIIEAHQGRLWAARNDGPGSTFSFSVPCRHEGLGDTETSVDRGNPSTAA